MAVRVVTFNAGLQPDDFRDAEVFSEIALGVAFRKNRITVFIEQALLRRQGTAFAVDVDRSAFKHNAGPEQRQAETFADEVRDVTILQQLLVFVSPSVEPPLHDSRLPFAPVHNKCRPVIPEPNVRVIPAMKANLAKVDTGLLKRLCYFDSHIVVSDGKIYDFRSMQFLNDANILLFDFFHTFWKGH